jgi:hypothetical protein
MYCFSFVVNGTPVNPENLSFSSKSLYFAFPFASKNSSLNKSF